MSGKPAAARRMYALGLLAALVAPLWASPTDARPGQGGAETPLGSEPRPSLPTLVLWEGAQAMSISGDMLVYDSAGAKLDPAGLGFIPDALVFRSFDPDQAGRYGSGSRWVALTVRNLSGYDDWVLTSYLSDARPSLLVAVAEDGTRHVWRGVDLDDRVLDTGLSNVSALSLSLTSGTRWTVYVRMEGHGRFFWDLRLWRLGALTGRLILFTRVAGIVVGAMAILYLAAMVIVVGRSVNMPGYLVFAAASLLLVMLSLRGAGTAGLALGPTGGRLALDLLFCAQGLSLLAVGRQRYGGRKARAWRPGIVCPAAYAAILLLSALLPSTVPHLAMMGILLVQLVQEGVRGVAAFRTDRWLRSSMNALWLLPASGLAGAFLAAAAPRLSELDVFFHLLPIALFLHALLMSFALGTLAIQTRLNADKDYARAFKRLERVTADRDNYILGTARALAEPLDTALALVEEIKPADHASGSVLALARAQLIGVATLVANTLVYLRLRAGVLRPQAETFNLAPVLRAAVNLTAYLRAGRDIRERFEVPLIELRNDFKGIQQLAYMVLCRVMKTRGLGEYRVEASADSHLVRFELSDDGVEQADAGPEVEGLPSEYRGDDSGGPARLLAEEAGAVDLVVCSRLARELGGSFSYSRDGGRNRYSFVFPRSMSWRQYGDAADAHREYGSPEALSVDLAAKARPGGMILAVDDDPLSLFALKRRLEEDGWSVDARVSALDALNAVSTGSEYQAAVVDADMPEISGFELCTLIRVSKEHDAPPVILILDSARKEDLGKAFGAGARDFVVRPVGGSELSARVRTQVDLAKGVARDREQRARMAEVDKFKTLGWLTAGVAHEINTPNNAVLRNVPMLREIWAALAPEVTRLGREREFAVQGFSAEDLAAEVPEMLNDLYMGAQHIRRIVSDLKDYARGSSAGQAEAVDVNQVVGYASRLLRHTISVCTRRAVFNQASGLPPVRADRLKLTQVVVNVMENALQALPDPDKGIEVSTYAEGGGDSPSWVCVRVRDEGAGMSPDVLSSVFDPFFTTRRERGGTGLGMPVSAGIVRELGGAIELHSTLGRGTEAIIRLPALRDKEGAT